MVLKNYRFKNYYITLSKVDHIEKYELLIVNGLNEIVHLAMADTKEHWERYLKLFKKNVLEMT